MRRGFRTESAWDQRAFRLAGKFAMSEREIFDAALAIEEPARRAAYIEEACASDATLRAHIVGLLEMHGRLGSFLEASRLAAPTMDEPILERPGAVIGPYKLMEE